MTPQQTAGGELSLAADPQDLQRRSEDLARKTPLSSADAIAAFGASEQGRAGQVANRVLAAVTVKESGQAGQLLLELGKKLRSVDVKTLSARESSHVPIFGKLLDSVRDHVAGYEQTVSAVDKLAQQLSAARAGMLDDVKMLDSLYDENRQAYEDVTVAAGAMRIHIAEFDQKLIPAAEAKASGTGNPADAQEANDLKTRRQQADRKLADLEMTRMLRIQNAPKIRMIQAGDVSLADQLQNSVVNGVALFKDNLAMAIAQSRQGEAAKIQGDFSNTLNDMIKQGADALHDNSVKIAQQAQRPIVDVETLKHQQDQLLRTIDDVSRIAQAGADARVAARQELAQMESDLRAKLAGGPAAGPSIRART